MSNTTISRPRFSIRIRLLLLLLAITLVATVSIAVVAAIVTEVTARNASEVSNSALTDQAGTYLVQLTQGSARENDQMLNEVRRETEELAEYARSVIESPPGGVTNPTWQADAHMTFGPDGQFINNEKDVSSVFAPNTAPINRSVIADVELSAYMDSLFPGIFNTTPDIEAVYFATPRDVVRYYPNVNLGAVLPADFRASTRPWFTGSILENNPGGGSWWTDPYLDATGLGLVTTAAAPVYASGGDLLGVVGLDITLVNLSAAIESNRILQTGYSFMIDAKGRAIALPDQGYLDILDRTASQADINIDLGAQETPFSEVITAMIAGKTGLSRLEAGGRELFVAYVPLASTGWSIASVVDADEILAATAGLRTNLTRETRNVVFLQIMPVSILVFILVTLIGLVVGNRLVVPLQNLSEAARKLGAGDYDISLPPASNDEIGVLADAFEHLVSQVRQLVGSLENSVADRTADLERRTTQLQVASEIAREAAEIRDLSTLLEHAVNLIRSRFGFYHAGIFLIDDRHEFAVLRAATGEAGRAMLERQHRLKVGEVGIVGRVTGTGLSRISLDVADDEAHYRNPLLPETRSEMALPLKIGDHLIGALDVQSQEPDAFSQDDIAIMQTLADQLAIAIENARLIENARQSLEQMERLYATISHDTWREVGQTRQPLGYVFESGDVNPLRQKQEPSQTAGQAKPVSIPIEVRGQVIASLDVWPGPEGLEPEELQLISAVTERIGQAMDGARLFEETQLRARSERIISNITSRVRETLDMDTVMQTAASEIRRTLNLSEAEIRLGQPPAREPGPARNGNGHNS